MNKYEYQYQFDAAGNRTQMKYYDGSTTTTTSYTHNDGNQLTAREVGAQDYSYTYDNNGNMTAELDNKDDPIREFTWNRDDRLIAANRDEFGTSSYVYDALGRRLVRTSGTTSTFYYYDGLTVIAEKQKVGAGNWDWQRIFTVAPGVIGNIFRISEMSGGNWTDAYYHYDAIGNVVLRTNGYGGVLESLDQEAYGNVKIGSQSGYHLTTKEYDSISELHYFAARWYDNAIGIFISKSPLSVRAEHPFNLCENNPITYLDFNGLLSDKEKEKLKRATDQMVESCGFRKNNDGRIVGGERKLDDAEKAACCEAMRQMGLAIWGAPSWWESLLIGGASVVNQTCANNCACGGGGKSGQDLVKDYAKCMGDHADDLFGGGMFGIPGITP